MDSNKLKGFTIYIWIIMFKDIIWLYEEWQEKGGGIGVI